MECSSQVVALISTWRTSGLKLPITSWSTPLTRTKMEIPILSGGPVSASNFWYTWHQGMMIIVWSMFEDKLEWKTPFNLFSKATYTVICRQLWNTICRMAKAFCTSITPSQWKLTTITEIPCSKPSGNWHLFPLRLTTNNLSPLLRPKTTQYSQFNSIPRKICSSGKSVRSDQIQGHK